VVIHKAITPVPNAGWLLLIARRWSSILSFSLLGVDRFFVRVVSSQISPLGLQGVPAALRFLPELQGPFSNGSRSRRVISARGSPGRGESNSAGGDSRRS